jgi:beta-barrel assembly-enhancing protease
MQELNRTFNGGVFHQSIEGGRAGASIYLTTTEVVADTIPMNNGNDSSPSEHFTIPLRECQIEIGGASGRMVFCRTPDRQLTIFSEEKGFAASLKSASYGELTGQIDSAKKLQKKEASSFRFWLFVSAAACAAFLFVGYFAVLGIAKVAIEAMPISVDEKIGKMAIQSMDLGTKLNAKHEATELVKRIVDELRPHAAIKDMDFQITVVNEDTVNAFALPGGQMVVYTGLIEKAESVEQIAGVIAHEMAHATKRHGLKGMSQSLGIVVAIQVMVGDVGGLVALGSQLAQESILTSYSRGAETEADLEGARMLHEAKIDPAAMAEFFQILQHEHGDLPGVMAWISTHPQHADRVANIEAYKKTLPSIEYRKLDFNLEAVKAKLSGS